MPVVSRRRAVNEPAEVGRAGSAELVFPNLVILVIISQLRSCERASSSVFYDVSGLHKSAVTA